MDNYIIIVYNNPGMNIFTSKNRKKIKWIWGLIGILVIVSMIVLYSGVLITTR